MEQQTAHQTCEAWLQFLTYAKTNTSISAFHNWLSPIEVMSSSSEKIVLKVPNIFVKEYLLTNFKQDLLSFVPVLPSGEPALEFIIEKHDRKSRPFLIPQAAPIKPQDEKEELEAAAFEAQLNSIDSLPLLKEARISLLNRQLLASQTDQG
jgi:chromosomal replication initiator protein